jgi:hypothetical protein
MKSITRMKEALKCQQHFWSYPAEIRYGIHKVWHFQTPGSSFLARVMQIAKEQKQRMTGLGSGNATPCECHTEFQPAYDQITFDI